jgi:PknH-like extracellular domain
VQRPDSDPDTNTPACVSAVDPNAAAPDASTGFVQRYGRDMIDTDSGGRVDASVTEFATPHQASEHMKRTAANWQHCANTNITLARQDSTQQVRFGDRTDEHGIQTIATESTEGTTTRQCSHATTAVSNVVTDVVVCAPNASAVATALADAIRKRFPK